MTFCQSEHTETKTAAADSAAVLWCACYNAETPMRNAAARQLGEELKAVLERLRGLAREERAARSPDAEAIEIAIVNLDSAVEILTE